MPQKVGRNDPCPCGSGKKYKQCCMLKEKEEAASAKYTAAGKRKFKAKVISLGETGAAIFSRTAPTGPQAEPAPLDPMRRLKFKMTKKDFRATTEEKEEKIPFHIPKPDEPFETPEAKEKHLPKEEEPFKATGEDFRQ